MNQNKSSLSIGLLDNCYHSLKRGYELWNIVKERNDINERNADDGWLLKESIIWVHHGIELALKKMLAQVNECFIFEKLDDEKFWRALGKYKKDNKDYIDVEGTNNISIIHLFNEDVDSKSISFTQALTRAVLMLDIEELYAQPKKTDFRKNIDRLTNYRNRLIHFSLDLNIDEVTVLLGELLEPLLKLLKTHIKDINFRDNYLPKIRETAKGVQELAKTKTEKNQERIINIMNAFKGKEVPGHIFNQEDDPFRLPTFSKVKKTQNIAVDIIGHISGDERWLVQIKIGTIFFMGDLPYIKTEKYGKCITKWLVFLTPVDSSKIERLKKSGLLVSSLKEIEELEKELNINGKTKEDPNQ